MYKSKQCITFFSSRPHKVHVAFAESVNADTYLFRFDGKTKKPYVELIRSPFIKKPYSDVYLCESPLYLFTVIPQKILHPEIKVILLATSPFRMYYEKQGLAGRYILERSLGHVDGIIAVSRYVADFYSTLCSCPVKVAYPYADIDTYKGKYSDLNSHNIVFLGKMMPYKGVDILAEAFRIIRKDMCNARLFLMGHFKDASTDIPDIDGLEMVGKVDDPREYFSKASIYMHPAREEAFGISIIEACASGLLPIVSKNTGAAEVISPICPELIVDSLNPEDFAKKAIEVMGWDHEKKMRITSALRVLSEEFRKDARVREFRAVFEDLMSEIGPSRR